jgi:hypothetical protein
MNGRWKRWASPISTVMAGVPAAVASRRSVPDGPWLSMIRFEAKALATRAAVSSAMSARAWSMFVRPRVDV